MELLSAVGIVVVVGAFVWTFGRARPKDPEDKAESP
jgi:hypothetical protein